MGGVSEMKLSEELGKWRCDRPDEWKMDEFQRNAEKLEAERDALVLKLQTAEENARQQRDMKAKAREQRDALAAKVKNLENELRQRKLIHIGFTNESQVQYVTEQKEDGSFYPDSDNGCYIPVYMLDVHAHRVGSDSEIYKEHCELWKQRKQIAEIRAEAGRAGFIAGCHCGANYNIHDWDSIADKFAAKVRQGGAE